VPISHKSGKSEGRFNCALNSGVKRGENLICPTGVSVVVSMTTVDKPLAKLCSNAGIVTGSIAAVSMFTPR
jgi:hypothetical protein